MLISVAEADARITAALQTGPSESVPLEALAGRILREPITTPRPMPPFDRVMMDGVALSAEAWQLGARRFRVVGRIHAGEPTLPLPSPDTCLWVMTGAVCPPGAGIVVPREEISDDGEFAMVAATFEPPSGGFIHREGSDLPAGATLLEAGSVVDGAALGVIASAGRTEAAVSSRPRVAIVSTGDELVEPGVDPLPHQVVRSNPYAIAGLLRRHVDCEIALFHLTDERASMEDRLRSVLDGHDFVICSGGVSKGDRDFLPDVLTALGVECAFHGVAQRPGKPFWFGSRVGGPAVFALPGNPVSSLVGARRHVVPAIEGWLGSAAVGRTASVRLSAQWRPMDHLSSFVPVQVRGGEAHPRPVNNSGDFAHLVHSDGFVEFAPGSSALPVGAEVPYFAW